MSYVSGDGDRRGRWAAALRRAAAAPYAPAVAGGLLAAFAAAQAIATPVRTTGASAGLPHIAFVLLALAATLPVGLSRTYPPMAAVAVCAASVLSVVAFHALPVAGLVAVLILLYRLGRSGSQVLAALLALPFLVLALAGPAVSGAMIPMVLLAALGPAVAWAGSARRASTEAAEYSAARAVIAGSMLEHTARGERARVTRDLHDVVAHHISMISVQAETARLTTPGMPAAGARQLSAIGDTARAALTEMRRLLGVLREDTRTGAAVRRPQPTLLQLNELLDEARDASGAGVRLIIHGPMTTLDPGIELTAYRIIQEALTNARRHAEGAAVDVELHYTADALRLRVRDNGPGPPPSYASDGGIAPPLGGHGLLGMRERAAAVGGDLRTGAAAGGGFLVEATLPTPAEAAA
jgi:signal transduction histidine kinase